MNTPRDSFTPCNWKGLATLLALRSMFDRLGLESPTFSLVVKHSTAIPFPFASKCITYWQSSSLTTEQSVRVFTNFSTEDFCRNFLRCSYCNFSVKFLILENLEIKEICVFDNLLISFTFRRRLLLSHFGTVMKGGTLIEGIA